MSRKVATTKSHAEEINSIDPRAKLLRVPLISVILRVPVECQKVVAKVLKIFLINRFTGDSNDYAL